MEQLLINILLLYTDINQFGIAPILSFLMYTDWLHNQISVKFKPDIIVSTSHYPTYPTTRLNNINLNALDSLSLFGDIEH